MFLVRDELLPPFSKFFDSFFLLSAEFSTTDDVFSVRSIDGFAMADIDLGSVATVTDFGSFISVIG